MKQNLLSNKLQQGLNVYGTCVTSPGPLWPASIAGTGLDFVFIDSEHIPLDRNELALLCQAFRAAGVSPVVRIPSPDPYKACQAIDGGAQGVVAPYLESVSQIKDLVAACKYRPLKGELLNAYLDGSKAMDPSLKKYIESYNNALCIANIESVPALERLDELLSVPGLDAVFIGPHDLSVSLGLPEQYDHPEFIHAAKQIIHTTRAKGLSIGIHFSLEPERQVFWMKEGVNMVVHSFDIALFLQRLRRDLKLIKQAAGDLPGDDPGERLIV
jgi:4-hydroxy-2-oxoheptanedioate aldolase